jgi:Membrane protein involved in the export of O-antigen and teichoic acid
VSGPADAGGFSRNLAALSAIKLVGLGSSFLAAVVAARLLEPSVFGAAGVAQAFVVFVAVVANCGLSMAAIYRLRRSEAVAREVRATVGLAAPLAALAGICAGVGLVVGGRAMGLQPDAALVATALVLAAATVMADVTGSMLLGVGANTPYTIAEGLRYLSTLPLVLVVLLVLPSAAGYLAASAVAVIIATVFASAVVKRRAGTIRPQIDLPTWGKALRFGLRGQPGNVLQYFSLRVDLVLVGALAGLGPAAVYLVVTRIAEVSTQVANAATSFLFPAVATVGAPSRLTGGVIRAVIVIVTAMSIGLAVIGPALLGILFGSPYDTGYPALIILLIASIPLSYSRLISGDIKGRGRPGLVSIASMIGVPITILGDVLFVPLYGIVGAAAVSLVAYGATAFALARAYRDVSGIPAMDLVPTRADVGLVGRRLRDAARRLAWRGKPGRTGA